MTVATSYAALSYSGNGATTAFAVSWPFLTGSLVVTLISASGAETVQTLTTHYTVSGGGASEPATGTVTMVTAPPTGASLRIERATPETQATSWGSFDAFPQETVEASFDKLTLLVQERATKTELDNLGEISLAIGTVTTGAAGSSATATVTGTAPDYTLNLTIPRGETGASGNGTGDVVGPASATANAIALFDGVTGKIIKSSTYTITAAGAALIDDADAAAQRTTLGVGTADSPQFAGVNVGHATDTTITRVSAGVVAVEGNTVRTAGNDATAAQILANTASVGAITPNAVWTAAAPVSLTDSSTVAVDMSTFVNATVTLGGNRTLGNPTNAKPGQSGVILIKQDVTGSRTLAYGSNWYFPGDTAPTLSTTASYVDKLFYFVETTSIIHAELVRDSR